LYRFGIRKLVCEEEQILEIEMQENNETPGNTPGKPDVFSPKYQAYKEKW